MALPLPEQLMVAGRQQQRGQAYGVGEIWACAQCFCTVFVAAGNNHCISKTGNYIFKLQARGTMWMTRTCLSVNMCNCILCRAAYAAFADSFQCLGRSFAPAPQLRWICTNIGSKTHATRKCAQYWHERNPPEAIEHGGGHVLWSVIRVLFRLICHR